MKKGNGVSLFLINGGMELSWLYAWATFLAMLTFHQPFPFKEAIGPFVLASASLSSQREGDGGSSRSSPSFLGFYIVPHGCLFQRRSPSFG
jgi:hypothetical protein